MASGNSHVCACLTSNAYDIQFVEFWNSLSEVQRWYNYEKLYSNGPWAESLVHMLNRMWCDRLWANNCYEMTLDIYVLSAWVCARGISIVATTSSKHIRTISRYDIDGRTGFAVMRDPGDISNRQHRASH
jgi:hypothetical protein